MSKGQVTSRNGRSVRRSLFGLILGNAVSPTGNVVAVVAIPWFVVGSTGSSAKTRLAAFCTTVPLGLGALAGRTRFARLAPRRAPEKLLNLVRLNYAE